VDHLNAFVAFRCPEYQALAFKAQAQFDGVFGALILSGTRGVLGREPVMARHFHGV
jgi:hypothetical protein